MNDLRYKLIRFFSGRYGFDLLGYFILGAFFLFRIAAIIVPSAIAGLILDILSIGILFLFFFRIFSRNIQARRKENERLTKFVPAIKNRIDLSKNKWRDRKTHIYRKCPDCHVVLRLKKTPGEHTAVCPKCGSRIRVVIK